MSKLWYEQAAKSWDEAMPLGNGRLGAMLLGEVNSEVITLNEDSVWYGGPMQRDNPDALKYLPKLRELIFSGQNDKADKLLQYAFTGTPFSSRTYQKLADLHIEYDLDETKLENYYRELDLEEALARLKFSHAGTTYTREAFVSKPHNVFVIKFKAQGEGKLNFSAKLTREVYYDLAKQINPHTVMIGGTLSSQVNEFATIMSLDSKDGQVKLIGETLIVEDAREATLYLSALTSYRSDNLEADLSKTLEAAQALAYADLKAEHIKDYQELYKRVELELSEQDKHAHLPTDKRLAQFKESKDDNGLMKLSFDFGRYLTIASSRKGSLATTLQGIWNKDMYAPWGCQYTININTEMNYWPADKCNLAECHEPLFALIKKMVPNGRKTARTMYNCRGWVAHHNTDLWGDTAVQEDWIPGSYWVMGGAWLCTHIFNHYEYTKDKEFLKEYFPIMREAALFFLDFLIEDEEGRLITCPSVSPENSFIMENGKVAANTYAATMDNQLLRDLFKACIVSADILNVDDDLNAELKEAIKKLPETEIGKYGQIKEWQIDYKEAEPGHRHVSHLYGLYPSEQINVYDTPELTEAAKVSLKRRLSSGGGHTSWSRAWIVCLYARLQKGEKAYANLAALLADQCLDNLFTIHPPFQIDGNFGLTAGIAEMLVQKYEDKIVLLPALPKKWSSGTVKGLKLKDNLEIDIVWEDHKVQACTIYACEDLKCNLVYNDASRTISIEAGQNHICL